MQIFPCGNASQNQPLARRSFFRCSTTQLKWNHGSTGLLVVVQSDVDKTNQSYYGESKLCYLTTDGKHEGLVPLRMFLLLLKELIIDCIISIRITSSSFSKKKNNNKLAGKEGPVHDAQWSYSGLEFAVVYGCILFSVIGR